MTDSFRVELRDVSKQFGGYLAVDDLSLQIRDGEFFSLIGPSGCGKTTTLRMIAGFEQPTEGHIFIGGQPVEGIPAHRRPVNTVFQNYALFPHMTVADNVAFGLEMDGVGRAARRQQALAQLEIMGLAGFADHFPHELSGGMKQRAAIARAFVTQPDILLMDEPLRALDAQTRLVVQEELLSLWEKTRPMVLYVTHDIEEALLLADRVLVMSGRPGRVRKEIVLPCGRPRNPTERSHPEIEELKWQIWKLLEGDVRRQVQPQPAPST